jgi:transposase
MERLEAKKINGRTYYYYSSWAWVDGKCRRVWQKYLGSLENIARVFEEGAPSPTHAEVFQWGLPTALYTECSLTEVTEEINRLCPKRDQGLSTGDYISIAAINRAISPSSKRSMWDWFSRTALLRYFPKASQSNLSSQRFWDHMERIDADKARFIWQGILKKVSEREQIDISSISYDGTNFYTFIDTFNSRCRIAERGKNKQGRDNLRQVSYALFCSADGHIPLYYDIYEGNRNDARQFPEMLKSFHSFLKSITGENCKPSQITLIFDKGNNSAKNFAFLDSLNLKFVGSVKLDEHKELADIPNDDPRLIPCQSEELESTRAFKVQKEVYGNERTLVVTFNQHLFDTQFQTLHNDLNKATEKLNELQQKLDDRITGKVTKGKKPTLESIEKQCQEALHRQHLSKIIRVEIKTTSGNLPSLKYAVDNDSITRLANTYLGKTLIITNHKNWESEQIIRAYRSQFIIEDVFKEMKDRQTGSWWPMYHWTDSKIRVHGLYCTIAVLLRALMYRRVTAAGLNLSLKRMLSELNSIREVINTYPAKRKKKEETRQSVLTKLSPIQEQLMSILSLNKLRESNLG